MSSFEDQLRAAFGDTMEKAHEVVREVVEEAGGRLISRTPIDTGRAKSNWNYGLMTPDTMITEATNIRTVNGLSDMPSQPAGFVHYLTNSLAYAPALERGHSKQAPQGMVGLTILEMDDIVASAIRRVQQQ